MKWHKGEWSEEELKQLAALAGWRYAFGCACTFKPSPALAQLALCQRASRALAPIGRYTSRHPRAP
jgi:hypothetical protein